MSGVYPSTAKPKKEGSKVVDGNPSGFHGRFMFKAALAAIFLLVFPVFSSQAPESINETVNGRSWELLQLVFVGIVVSYGLFSKRNAQTARDYGFKVDRSQSDLSGLLPVSSVFDDEADNQSFFSDDTNGGVQTWSSQYRRGEPVVLVAKGTPVVDKNKGDSFQIDEKRLFLPVRSLKSRVADSDDVGDSTDFRPSASLRRSVSDATFRKLPRSSEDRRIVEEKETVVLRSPIPWSSRSGRIDVKENRDGPPLNSLPSKLEDSGTNNPTSRSSGSSSPSLPSKTDSNPCFPSQSSRKSTAPLPSESRADKSEVPTRKMSYIRSSHPPPPPPLPPPAPIHSKSLPARKKSPRKVFLPPPPPPPPPPPSFSKHPPMKSTSTMTDDSLLAETEMIGGTPTRTNSGKKPVANWDCPPIGRSEDTVLMEKEMVEIDEAEETTESEEDYFEWINPNKEEEEGGGSSMGMEGVEDDEGPDVDKKADEFIAKFREQIRLQRIASIRRSTEMISRNSGR